MTESKAMPFEVFEAWVNTIENDIYAINSLAFERHRSELIENYGYDIYREIWRKVCKRITQGDQ